MFRFQESDVGRVTGLGYELELTTAAFVVVFDGQAADRRHRAIVVHLVCSLGFRG